MSMADFEGALTFDVSIFRGATDKNNWVAEEIPLSSDLNLAEFVRLVGKLDAGLEIKVVTNIFPHEDSNEELRSWKEVVKVSNLR